MVAALTALALAAGQPLTGEWERQAASTGEAALTTRAAGLDPAVVPAKIEAQRDALGAQRPTKQRLMPTAVTVAILGLVRVARRRAFVRGAAPRPLAAWLAVHGSRSPPSFQPLTP